jgi:hypothetical protein
MKISHVILIILLLSNSSWAAKIIKDTSIDPNFHFITVSGTIESGDGAKFSRIVEDTKNGFVILDSPGGAVLSGLEIGRQIKSKKLMTGVPSSTLCASSCALIWLAGATRYAEDSSIVGFHAAYVIRNGKQVETGVGNALIGAYLNELGLSDRAIIFVTQAPPEGIEQLTKFKGEQIGIGYKSAAEISPTRSTKKDFQIADQPYDPLKVAVSFYQSLSLGDGSAAAALVVPEKRGIGPFNERNIGQFFGSMQEPLKVNSVKLIGSDTVEVNYTYRYTKSQCIGRAIVETGYFMGNTLIKKISANC